MLLKPQYNFFCFKYYMKVQLKPKQTGSQHIIIQYHINIAWITCKQIGKITIIVKIKNYIQLNKGWLMREQRLQYAVHYFDTLLLYLQYIFNLALTNPICWYVFVTELRTPCLPFSSVTLTLDWMRIHKIVYDDANV